MRSAQVIRPHHAHPTFLPSATSFSPTQPLLRKNNSVARRPRPACRRIHGHHPATPPTTVAAITSATDTQELARLVAQLSIELNALKEEHRQPSRQHSPSTQPQPPRRYRRRSGSKSRPPSIPGVCYYHRRFGNDSIKCTKSCTFTGQASNRPGER